MAVRATGKAQTRRQSGGSSAGGAFHALLAANPETRALLEERLKAFPEYQSFVQEFGAGVLSALSHTTA